MKDSFGWWSDYESFVHYDATLITLGPELQAHGLEVVAMDTGCKWVLYLGAQCRAPAVECGLTSVVDECGCCLLMRRYASHGKAVLSTWLGAWADKLKYAVGWLHSKAGHKLDCQLQFCSMYMAGAGRMPAENMEQVHVRLL